MENIEQQPEMSPEQAAQIQARPRRTLKPRSTNTNTTSQSSSQAPESMAEPPKDNGKGIEDLQTRFRFDGLLAAERAKWELEKRGLLQMANEAEEELREKLREKDRDCRKAYSKGSDDAVSEHSGRWTSMDEQQANDKKQLQIQKLALDQEKGRLEHLERGDTNALKAELAAKGKELDAKDKDIAAKSQEIDRLTRDGIAWTAGLQRQLSEKDEELQRGKVEVQQYAASLQQQLAQQSTDLRNQLGTEMQNQLESKLAEYQRAYSSPKPIDKKLLERNRLLRRKLVRSDRSPRLGDSQTRPKQQQPEAQAAPTPEKPEEKPKAKQGDKNPEPAEASAEASEEIRRLQKAVTGLEERAQKLWEGHWELSETKRELGISFAIKGRECDDLARKAGRLEAAAKEWEGKEEGLRAEVAEMGKGKEAAETETRSLREAIGALQAEENRLAANSSSAIAELEALVDERLEAWREWVEAREADAVVEVEAGGRGMDSPLGVPEKAVEGFLRPQFPGWTVLVFLLLLGALLWCGFPGVGGGEREVVWVGPEVDQAGPDSVWQDPLLDLSRGMFGV